MSYSADLLEFPELRELLARYVHTEPARTLLSQVEPRRDRAGLEESLAEVGEAMEYLRAASRPQPAARGAAVRIRFSELPDASAGARKLRIEGAELESTEILQLIKVLDRASEARVLLIATGERFRRLGARAAQIGEFRSVLRDLAGKIEPDGRVADHASPALARLRRDIERQQRAVQESLERFLRIHKEEGILQEEFVTIRNDRFVVPLIAGQQRKVEGVIHGASGSGHTLFVEPLETIELNNDLVRLTEEELREVHRVLREMTERLRAHSAGIALTLEVMAELELEFGVAQFGLDFGCVVPRFSPETARRLLLRDARHPLLEDILRRQKREVVPVSLELDDARRTLLISGPNTGGKTVTIKAAGLLALMAHAGLPVPCAEAEFPFFDCVLADIGDQQSIQESLSTFSAHVARIRDTAEAVTRDSLVLLDELGRATDPEEGGALGIAILELFRAAGAFTLGSTHLMALKVYGSNTEGVINGSMGFDDRTLAPTYVLRLGAPGRSAGLEIAGRLGLPQPLMDRARAALSSSEHDIARFLSQLHDRLEQVDAQQQALERERQALAAREKAIERDWTQRETAKLKELERRCDLLMEKFDSEARATIDTILKGAEQRKASEQAMRRVAKAKREFRDEMRATVLETQDQSRTGDLFGKRPMPREGDRVRLRNIRDPARVRRKLSGGLLEVEAGLLKLQVSEDDVLEVLPAAPDRGPLPSNVKFEPGPSLAPSLREINVIGQRADEACSNVDKFLDNAAMASIERVRIVHGHGMGILKKAIAELLKSNPHVATFYAAPPAEGGSGATIVEMK